MNKVKFYRLQNSTGTVECRRVKVAQPSYATLCKIQNGSKEISRNKTGTLPTVCEAEDKMLRQGWSRKKPTATALKKAA